MPEESEKSLERLYDPLDQCIGLVERLFVSEFGEPQYVRAALKNGLFKRASILLPVGRLDRSTHYTGLALQ